MNEFLSHIDAIIALEAAGYITNTSRDGKIWATKIAGNPNGVCHEFWNQSFRGYQALEIENVIVGRPRYEGLLYEKEDETSC